MRASMTHALAAGLKAEVEGQAIKLAEPSVQAAIEERGRRRLSSLGKVRGLQQLLYSAAP